MTTAALSAFAGRSRRTPRIPNGPPPQANDPISLLLYIKAIRANPIKWIQDRIDRYGDTYYVEFENRPLFVTRDPEVIRDTLIRNAADFQKPERGRAEAQLKRFLGTGLLTANGEFWRRNRRMIQPSFGKRHLDAYARTMVDYTSQALDHWKHGQHRDVSRDMMELTLRIVAKVLFDHETIGDADTVARTMETFRESVAGGGIIPKRIPTPFNVRATRAIRESNELIYGMIDERLANPTGGLDLLSTLCEAVDDEDGRGMAREQMRHEVLTLFLAGHETTSHALTWTLMLLAQHPEIRDRVFAEIDTVLGDRTPTAKDFPALVYTAQVLSEAMRKYPPAYVISRAAIRDTTAGPWDVMEGAEVLVYIYHTHHNPNHFSDPERFDPDRFSAENAGSIPQGGYLPFGAGTRTCIGKRFAMMEAVLILATVLQRFRPELAPGVTDVPRRLAVTMSPKGGMPMQVWRR